MKLEDFTFCLDFTHPGLIFQKPKARTACGGTTNKALQCFNVNNPVFPFEE